MFNHVALKHAPSVSRRDMRRRCRESRSPLFRFPALNVNLVFEFTAKTLFLTVKKVADKTEDEEGRDPNTPPHNPKMRKEKKKKEKGGNSQNWNFELYIYNIQAGIWKMGPSYRRLSCHPRVTSTFPTLLLLLVHCPFRSPKGHILANFFIFHFLALSNYSPSPTHTNSVITTLFSNK